MRLELLAKRLRSCAHPNRAAACLALSASRHPLRAIRARGRASSARSARRHHLDSFSAMAPSASWAVDGDGVAVVTLLNPPMNALAPQRACPPLQQAAEQAGHS